MLCFYSFRLLHNSTTPPRITRYFLFFLWKFRFRKDIFISIAVLKYRIQGYFRHVYFSLFKNVYGISQRTRMSKHNIHMSNYLQTNYTSEHFISHKRSIVNIYNHILTFSSVFACEKLHIDFVLYNP